MPAQRGECAQAHQQRPQAGARQGEHEPAPQDRKNRQRDELRLLPARVEQDRAEEDHDQGEEAAEDVRIEEHRVDREVRVIGVGGDQLGV